MALKKLPIGIDGFEKIIRNDFYYVDKTGFITDLLNNWGEVNLFTRPRRFGKSLNMSMLKSFFEIGCDKTLFDGLKITQEKELCDQYMGQFPVVSVTLKDVSGLSFDSACASMRSVIGREAARLSFLEESSKLTEMQKKMYHALTAVGTDGCFSMTLNAMEDSLKTLSELLFKHFGRKVILLIDEYDVPLDKAFQAGYYEEMVSLIRNMFSNALKTNDNLQFAVLTGCLRISKESIFTGLNNLNVMTVTDDYFSDSFGFTEDEVKELLEYYGCEKALDTVRKWYDGYRFGKQEIYCPWDVIKYCQALLKDKNAYPQNYWANTSGNGMVRRFIDKSTAQTKHEIEQLIAGETIIKPVSQELTYSELDKSIENLWSVLFTTGYLTQCGCLDGTNYKLVIPNLEIRDLFVKEIKEWFNETSKQDNTAIDSFCSAFLLGNTELIEKQLNKYLWNSISIRDTAVRKERKENFYHGMLLGILQYEENWVIKSNEESGIGYSDILIETPDSIGIVIELKYAENGGLESQCMEALAQIEENQYEARLMEDGMETILKYGIAFYKKKCKVVSIPGTK
jgi:hypothetical protein